MREAKKLCREKIIHGLVLVGYVCWGHRKSRAGLQRSPASIFPQREQVLGKQLASALTTGEGPNGWKAHGRLQCTLSYHYVEGYIC